MLILNKLRNIIRSKFGEWSKNKHFNYGVPFVGTILLGIVMLRISQSIRFEFRRVKTLTPEELEYYESKGINVKNPVTIEQFYEEIKDLADQKWENVRIPRPWEETPTK